ncbi:MAG TPA: hypothetical protein VFI42_13995 [Thermomicrobiaceae bacterium]|nr:hypothetical protein [Thermomicrobiaceae bacterium]
MRNLNVKLVAALLVVSLALSALVMVPLASGRGGAILEFNTMTGVSGPFVGSTNPIRGINGGGLPWTITDGHGVLLTNGTLELEVHGLVFSAGPNTGTNTVPSFMAIVSCLSINDGGANVVNVSTGLFPATASGDAHIHTQVSLPSPCIAPIVFVTSPGGAWFAATGA